MNVCCSRWYCYWKKEQYFEKQSVLKAFVCIFWAGKLLQCEAFCWSYLLHAWMPSVVQFVRTPLTRTTIIMLLFPRRYSEVLHYFRSLFLAIPHLVSYFSYSNSKQKRHLVLWCLSMEKQCTVPFIDCDFLLLKCPNLTCVCSHEWRAVLLLSKELDSSLRIQLFLFFSLSLRTLTKLILNFNHGRPRQPKASSNHIFIGGEKWKNLDI